jgi:hypothetical protein
MADRKHLSFIIHHSSFILSPIRVTNGTRTRDVRHHKPALYQLSYGHHLCTAFYRNLRSSQYVMIIADAMTTQVTLLQTIRILLGFGLTVGCFRRKFASGTDFPQNLPGRLNAKRPARRPYSWDCVLHVQL